MSEEKRNDFTHTDFKWWALSWHELEACGHFCIWAPYFLLSWVLVSQISVTMEHRDAVHFLNDVSMHRFLTEVLISLLKDTKLVTDCKTIKLSKTGAFKVVNVHNVEPFFCQLQTIDIYKESVHASQAGLSCQPWHEPLPKASNNSSEPIYQKNEPLIHQSDQNCLKSQEPSLFEICPICSCHGEVYDLYCSPPSSLYTVNGSEQLQALYFIF